MSNLLAKENSPYLLQHADNPVSWYPWGPEALEAAQKRDVPIFLSIGYAACHWCHVMAHESFEDPQIAELLNEHFVSIKVDREERPDVDAVYMQAVTSITGQGGWPLSVFMTPEGQPFYGGTYFPPTRRYNLPSFADVLSFITQRWTEDRQSLLDASQGLTEHLRQSPRLTPSDSSLDPGVLSMASEALWRGYDWDHGGWGAAPKFPSASTIEFLLAKHVRDGDHLALDMAIHALDSMANGGVYDQLRGGFHRYSVDAQWLVPHFEKMLYDNALLGIAYLHAWQTARKPLHKRIALEIIEWLLAEMRSPAGGFFASLDADSEGEEGKFYVWTNEEIASILKDETTLALFYRAYGISKGGNFEGANVLHRPLSSQELAREYDLPESEIESRLQPATQALLAARSQRRRPVTDDKVIASWNGWTLTLLASAAQVLDRQRYLPIAQSLADFLMTEMFDGDQLYRAWRNGQANHRGMLEDYAAVANGLIDLYQADFDMRWLTLAQKLVNTIMAQFDDPHGGLFDSPQGQPDLIARPKSLQDSPTPSGNSCALRALLRLHSLSPDQAYEDKAVQAITAMQQTMEKYPQAFSAWLINLDWALGPVSQLAIIGDPANQDVLDLASVPDETHLPRLVRAVGTPDSQPSLPLLAGRSLVDGKPAAYLCQNFTCKLPTTKPEELRRQLQITSG